VKTLVLELSSMLKAIISSCHNGTLGCDACIALDLLQTVHHSNKCLFISAFTPQHDYCGHVMWFPCFVGMLNLGILLVSASF
jgi:hypothetical protein